MDQLDQPYETLVSHKEPIDINGYRKLLRLKALHDREALALNPKT